jgi:hypothetical protein
VKAFGLIAVLFLATGLVIYFSVALLGYYLNPITISLLAALLRMADVAFMPPEADVH